jgi:hypothetical protein
VSETLQQKPFGSGQLCVKLQNKTREFDLKKIYTENQKVFLSPITVDRITRYPNPLQSLQRVYSTSMLKQKPFIPNRTSM